MKVKDRRAQEQRGVTRRKRGGGSGLRRGPASYGDKSGRVVYFAAEGGVTEYDYADHLQETYGRREGQEFRLHQCHPGQAT